MTTAVNPLDASWLMIESGSNLMHVAGLSIFQLPPQAPGDFVHRLVETLRRYPVATTVSSCLL